MFEDLSALRQMLTQCLELEDLPTLHHWHTVLDETLPDYETDFTDVERALELMEGVEEILDRPLPADGEPGPDGDTMALELAHYLGWLADASDLSPWRPSPGRLVRLQLQES